MGLRRKEPRFKKIVRVALESDSMPLEKEQDDIVYTVIRPVPTKFRLFSIRVYNDKGTEPDMPCYRARQVHAHVHGEETTGLKPFYDSLAELESDLRQVGIADANALRQEWHAKEAEKSPVSH